MSKRKPARPTSLKAGPYTVEVRFCQETLEAYREQFAAPSCWGFYDPKQNLICVEPRLPLDRQRTCLEHEVSHLISDLAGVIGAEEVSEEEVTTVTAPIRVMVYRDNPEYLAWLLGA